MIRLEESGLERDGTRWRRRRGLTTMKPGVFPFPDEEYFGLGRQDQAPGFIYLEHEGQVRSVMESLVERVDVGAR